MNEDFVAGLTSELQKQLLGWKTKFADSPEREMEHLLLLALEREEIVAIGYREKLVERRLRKMPLDPEIKELIRAAMIWV